MGILITGVTGFAGGHLAQALLSRGGVQLHGTSRRGTWSPAWCALQEQVLLHACDLCDAAATAQLIDEVRPKQIYHLAGYAHAGQSFREADAAWAANLGATRQLYDAIHHWGGQTRILYVSSGLVYGDPAASDQAQDENNPLRPASPYASSKAAADLTSYQYTKSHGLDIVRVRPFNHIGPAQSPEYAIAHFAQQVAAIEKGRQPPLLETGNLNAWRDLTDVRDMVRSYILLMEQGNKGEVYNAGSGVAHSMEAVLARLLSLARAPIEVKQAPALARATDTAVIRADATRLRQQTGWQPDYALDQTLADTLSYWRQQH